MTVSETSYFANWSGGIGCGTLFLIGGNDL